MFKRPEIIIVTVVMSALIINLAMTPVPKRKAIEKIKSETKSVSKIDSTFSKEALIKYVYSLNLRFPHIVLAQAQLESGNFTSKIFRENNNLFGMKEAKSRPTNNQGTKRGHAKYNTWQESVIDYVFYYSVYLYKYKTEDAYYGFLDRNYAENSKYSKLIRQIAETYKQ